MIRCDHMRVITLAEPCQPHKQASIVIDPVSYVKLERLAQASPFRKRLWHIA